MNDDTLPPWPRPAEYKTKVDGRGGLIRVVMVGEPHEGRELFIDEKELPEEIFTSVPPHPFEWWTRANKEFMDRTPAGQDPNALPVRYVLRVPDNTGEPLFVSDTKAR